MLYNYTTNIIISKRLEQINKKDSINIFFIKGRISPTPQKTLNPSRHPEFISGSNNHPHLRLAWEPTLPTYLFFTVKS